MLSNIQRRLKRQGISYANDNIQDELKAYAILASSL